MRIFITSSEDGGIKRTRFFLENCTNTSELISKICKQIGANKNQVIIKLKYQPYQLVVVDGWPLSHYPIKNGSTFIVEFNFKRLSQQSFSSTNLLSKMEEDDVYQSFYENANKLSFLSNHDENENDDSKYLQESLQKLLEAIRSGNLEKMAEILHEEPKVEDETQLEYQMERKSQYLLNELGQYGRNALHQAIQINNLDIVSYLIIKGADPTIVTVDQFTPLQLAIIYHSPEILDVLLEQKKININQVTAHGTALHLAISSQEIKCIQILFQNDADVQTRDHDGRKAVELTSNIKLKQLLQNKPEIRRANLPKITKGKVSQIVSPVFSLKNITLVINPFKNEVTIIKQSKEIQGRFQVTLIDTIEDHQQDTVIFNNNLLHWKITLKNKDRKQLVFGVKNKDIYEEWITAFKTAISFRQICMYIKPVPSRQQLVQILKDETDQIQLYKRKVDFLRKSKDENSALLIPSNNNSTDNSHKIKERQSLTKSDDKLANFSEQSMLQKSEIMLGSIVKSQFYHQSQRCVSQQTERKIPISPSQSLQSNRLNNNFQNEAISQLNSTQNKICVSFRDFKVIKLIGNGSFGEVYLSKNLKNNKIYALKVLNKKKLLNKKQLKYAVGQVNILKKADFPFIISLYFAFQTSLNIYIALDNCSNGDLSELIIVKEKLNEDTSRFIIAQIILAIEYLHKNNILYRDLKPENILIAADGYVKLTDFGLSKQNCFSMSFCGSPAYLSPEMLEKKGVGFSSDIYGIGCVLYEMVVGQPPFFDQKLQKIFENIRFAELEYPHEISADLKSLIAGLLQRDISKRLGVNNFQQIKEHIFFKDFDWRRLLLKKIVPPSQMFINDQDTHFYHDIHLESSTTIKLKDADYDEKDEKCIKIKHFTFIKEGELGNIQEEQDSLK